MLLMYFLNYYFIIIIIIIIVIIIIIIIKVRIIIQFLPVVNIVFVLLGCDTVYFHFGRWLLLIQSTSAAVSTFKIDMTMRMEQ